MCDSSRPEEDGAVLQDLSVLETDFSAPPADVVAAPDPSSVAEVHVKTEEQQTREKMEELQEKAEEFASQVGPLLALSANAAAKN
jgi:hypothetical protein